MLNTISPIILSSTLSLFSSDVIMLEDDYSVEANEIMMQNKTYDPNEILYNILLEELVFDQFRHQPTIKKSPTKENLP